MKIAFENEMIIVNSQNEVQNFINSEVASVKIIKDLKKKFKKIMEKDCVIAELDACQLEIKNSWWKSSFNEAQDEILTIFEILWNFLQENYWLYFSQTVVPNQEYFPTSSWVYERYNTIMDGLISLWEDYSKATNVAWLHLNFDSNFEEYIKLNNKLYSIFKNNDFKKLWISVERLKKYQKTVKWVNKLFWYSLWDSFEYFENENDAKQKLFDENWNLNFDYNLLRLKKWSSSLVWELRSFDAWVNISDLQEKTKKAYDLILSLK